MYYKYYLVTSTDNIEVCEVRVRPEYLPPCTGDIGFCLGTFTYISKRN